MPDIWEPRPKLEKIMPWKIQKQDGQFCVVAESDGKTVKCHPTKEKAKSHLAALYVNEPSASKKSFNTGYGLLKSLITERVEELKGCGANKPGGGGFSAGNTCARGGGGAGSKDLKVGDSVTPKILKESGYKYYRQSGMSSAVYRNESSGKQLSVDVDEKGVPTKVRSISDFRGQKKTPKGKHTGFFEQGYD